MHDSLSKDKTYWTSRTTLIRRWGLGKLLIVFTPANAPDIKPI